MDKRHIALLNFTGNSYHWGCYGTAYEVYQTLLERGYTVETVDVSETHAARPTPELSSDFLDPAFFARFEEANRQTVRAMRHADIVVVNGEGTLHRGHNGPINLLYLMFAAKLFLNKEVQLINHSFYPSGGLEPSGLDELYGSVAAALDHVAPREPWSSAILECLGVAHTQGFDCLPRFIERHGMLLAAQGREREGILVTGGVTLPDAELEALGEILADAAAQGQRIAFTTGARNDPAPEDQRQFELLQRRVPQLTLAPAQSMRAWLESIAGARALVSGRYHHSIAAASLGTPFRAIASNTPKIQATMELLGGPAVVQTMDAAGSAAIRGFLDEALAGRAEPVAAASVHKVVALAANNFVRL